MRHAILLDPTQIASQFHISIFEVRMLAEALITYLSPAVNEIPYCLTPYGAFLYSITEFSEGGFVRWGIDDYGNFDDEMKCLNAYAWLFDYAVTPLVFDDPVVNADLQITSNTTWLLLIQTQPQGAYQ